MRMRATLVLVALVALCACGSCRGDVMSVDVDGSQHGDSADVSSSSSKHIMFVADDWDSRRGGAHMANRMLVELLAKHSEQEDVRITVMLPKKVTRQKKEKRAGSSHTVDVDLEEEVAQYISYWDHHLPLGDRVTLVYVNNEPKKKKFDDWLVELSGKKELGEREYLSTPLTHPVNIVLGHGTVTDRGASALAKHLGAQYWHMVHTLPDNLSFAHGEVSDAKRKREMDIIRGNGGEFAELQPASLVLGLGVLLERDWTRYIDVPFLALDPWLREERIATAGTRPAPGSAGAHLLTVGRMVQFAQEGVLLPAAALTQINEKRWREAGEPKYRLRGVDGMDNFKRIMEAAAVSEHFKSNYATVIEPRALAGSEQVREDLGMTDAVLLPSIAEAFGLVALEAMEAGVPVLTSSDTGFAKQLRLRKELHKLAQALIVNVAMDGGATVARWKAKLEEYIDVCRDVQRSASEHELEGWVLLGQALRSTYKMCFPERSAARALLETMGVKVPQHFVEEAPRSQRANLALVVYDPVEHEGQPADLFERVVNYQLDVFGGANFQVESLGNSKLFHSSMDPTKTPLLYSRIDGNVTPWQVLTMIDPKGRFGGAPSITTHVRKLQPDLLLFVTTRKDAQNTTVLHPVGDISIDLVRRLIVHDEDCHPKRWDLWTTRSLVSIPFHPPPADGTEWAAKDDEDVFVNSAYATTREWKENTRWRFFQKRVYVPGHTAVIGAFLPVVPRTEPRAAALGFVLDTLAAPLALCEFGVEAGKKYMTIVISAEEDISKGAYKTTHIAREAVVDGSFSVTHGSTKIRAVDMEASQARQILFTHMAAQAHGKNAIIGGLEISHVHVDAVSKKKLKRQKKNKDKSKIMSMGRITAWKRNKKKRTSRGLSVVAANQQLRKPRPIRTVEQARAAFVWSRFGLIEGVQPVDNVARTLWGRFVRAWARGQSAFALATPVSEESFARLQLVKRAEMGGDATQESGDEIDAEELLGHSVTQPVVIYGTAGEGKSTLMRFLAAKLAERAEFGLFVRADVLWARRDELHSADTADPLQVLAEVCTESMLRGLDYDAERCTPDDVHSVLRRAIASGECTLLVDALDELPWDDRRTPAFHEWVRGLLRAQGSDGALFSRIIFTSRYVSIEPLPRDITEQLHQVRICVLRGEERSRMPISLWRSQCAVAKMGAPFQLATVGDLNRFDKLLHNGTQLPIGNVNRAATDITRLPLVVRLERNGIPIEDSMYDCTSGSAPVASHQEGDSAFDMLMSVMIALEGKLNHNDGPEKFHLTARLLLERNRRAHPNLFDALYIKNEDILELYYFLGYIIDKVGGKNGNTVRRFDAVMMLELAAQMWEGNTGKLLHVWNEQALSAVDDRVSFLFAEQRTFSPLLTWLSEAMGLLASTQDNDYPLDEVIFFAHKRWQVYFSGKCEQLSAETGGHLRFDKLELVTGTKSSTRSSRNTTTGTSVHKRSVCGKHIVFVADDWSEVDSVSVANTALVELLAKHSNEDVCITVLLPMHVKRPLAPFVISVERAVVAYVEKWRDHLPLRDRVSFVFVTRVGDPDRGFSERLADVCRRDSSLDRYFSAPLAQPVDIVLGHGIAGAGASALAGVWGARYWHMVHTPPDENRQLELGIISGSGGQAASRVLGLGVRLKEWARHIDVPFLALDPWLREERIATACARSGPCGMDAYMLTAGRMDQLARKDALLPAAAMTQIEETQWRAAGSPKYHLHGVANMVSFTRMKSGAGVSKHFSHDYDRVIVPRAITDDDQPCKAAHMADGILLTFPSNGFELAALEAMEAGVPVIASNGTGFAVQLHSNERTRNLVRDFIVVENADDAVTVAKWKAKMESYVGTCGDMHRGSAPDGESWVLLGETLRSVYMASFSANAAAEKMLTAMGKRDALVREAAREPERDTKPVLWSLLFYISLAIISAAVLIPTAVENPARLLAWCGISTQYVIIGVPRGRPFYGRVKELSVLSVRLRPHKSNAVIATAISGPGGMGKTALAIEAVQRALHSPLVVWPLVVWCNASTLAALDASLVRAAEAVGVQRIAGDTDVVIAQRVRARLEERRKPWLLILDDVGRGTPLAHIKQRVPGHGPGSVLITSRHGDLGELHADIYMLPLAALPADEAVVLAAELGGSNARERADRDPAEAAARRRVAANVLGGLPLAIEQAAAFVRHGGSSFDAWTDDFVAQRTTLFGNTRAAPLSTRETVHATWRTSMALLREEDDATVAACGHVMRVLAVCAPDAIPHAVVAVVCDDHDVAVDDVLAALGAHSLVQCGERSVSVHRLVQAVVRDSVGDAAAVEALRVDVAALLVRVWPTWEEQNKAALRPLLVHGLHVLETCDTEAVELVDLARVCVGALQHMGLRAEAAHVVERVIDLRVAWRGDKEHPDVLDDNVVLGQELIEAERFEEAQKMLGPTLESMRRVLGGAHEKTLHCTRLLAFSLHELGQFGRTEGLAERTRVSLLSAREGEPNLASAQTILEVVREFARHHSLRMHKLEILWRAAVHAMQCGADSNADAAKMAKADLAAVEMQSENMRRQVLDENETKYGVDHPLTVIALDDLARTLRDHNKDREVADMYSHYCEEWYRVAVSSIAGGEFERARRILKHISHLPSEQCPKWVSVTIQALFTDIARRHMLQKLTQEMAVE